MTLVLGFMWVAVWLLARSKRGPFKDTSDELIQDVVNSRDLINSLVSTIGDDEVISLAKNSMRPEINGTMDFVDLTPGLALATYQYAISKAMMHVEVLELLKALAATPLSEDERTMVFMALSYVFKETHPYVASFDFGEAIASHASA